MNVFLVWSGDRSHQVALALKALLEMTVHGPSYFISDEIDGGKLWRYVLAQELEETDFGIVCVTPENRESRWLHFEAGAIAKAVADAHVVPFLYEMEPADLEQPLADFQARRAIEDETLALALQIARMRSNHKEPAVSSIFEKLAWPEFEGVLQQLAEVEKTSSDEEVRDSTSKLDEVLERVRSLESRSASGSPAGGSAQVAGAFWYVVPELIVDEVTGKVVQQAGPGTQKGPALPPGTTGGEMSMVDYKDGTVLVASSQQLKGLQALSRDEVFLQCMGRGLDPAHTLDITKANLR